MINIEFYLLEFFVIMLFFTYKPITPFNKIVVVKNYNPINGLRGILAPLVMFSHAYKEVYINSGLSWTYTQQTYFEYFGWGNALINAGKIGVAIFFMITGFLFYNLLSKPKINIRQFSESRFLRIYPLYFFVILTCCLYIYTSSGFILDSNFFYSLLKWLVFWGNNTYLSVSEMTQGVEWTLKIELLFYVTIPLVFYALHNHKNKLFKHAIILFSLLLIFIFCLVLRFYFDFYVDPRSVLCFYIGYLSLEIKSLKLSKLFLKNWFSIIAIISFITAFFITSQNLFYIFTIISISLLFISAACGNTFFGILMHDGIQKLGEISYSIYLIHGLVLYGLLKYSSVFLGNSLAGLLFIFIQFYLTFFVSTFTFKMIEERFSKSHAKTSLMNPNRTSTQL